MWKIKIEALLIIEGLGDAIELATKVKENNVSSLRAPK